MAKSKVASQTGSLTLNHKKSGIGLTLVHAGGVQHTIEKFSTRTITLL
jgi:hypothetical protein